METAQAYIFSRVIDYTFCLGGWKLWDILICFSGKTTVSALRDAQLLLNKQQPIWGGVYIHLTFFEQYRDPVVLP